MFRAAGCLAIVLLTLGGCGPGNQTPPSPPAVSEARQALIQVLDAWKAGEDAASLAQRSPVTYVADHDWSAGRKLVNYKLINDGAVFGNAARFDVELTLESSPSTSSIRTSYAVTLQPVVNIVRSDPSS